MIDNSIKTTFFFANTTALLALGTRHFFDSRGESKRAYCKRLSFTPPYQKSTTKHGGCESYLTLVSWKLKLHEAQV
jgi:hypothetical protein